MAKTTSIPTASVRDVIPKENQEIPNKYMEIKRFVAAYYVRVRDRLCEAVPKGIVHHLAQDVGRYLQCMLPYIFYEYNNLQVKLFTSQHF